MLGDGAGAFDGRAQFGVLMQVLFGGTVWGAV